MKCNISYKYYFNSATVVSFIEFNCMSFGKLTKDRIFNPRIVLVEILYSVI